MEPAPAPAKEPLFVWINIHGLRNKNKIFKYLLIHFRITAINPLHVNISNMFSWKIIIFPPPELMRNMFYSFVSLFNVRLKRSVASHIYLCIWSVVVNWFSWSICRKSSLTQICSWKKEDPVDCWKGLRPPPSPNVIESKNWRKD